MGARRACDGEPKPPWRTGAARFQVDLEVEGKRLIVATRCRLGSVQTEALLDTGAEWSLIGGELAIALEQEAEPESIELLRMSTRLGIMEGRLHRIAVTLLADEGQHLEVSASVLLAPDWTRPPVLGYRGFIERIRIGMDPGNSPGEQWLFFGSVAST